MRHHLRIFLLVTLTIFCRQNIFAQKDEIAFTQLEGFYYGDKAAPTGKEWESPEDLAYNKEQPHAYFFNFQDVTTARKLLPEHSSYWKSLDGTWKFNWVKQPDERPKDFYQNNYNVSSWADVPVPMSWNIYGIQKDGSLKYGVPIYVNQQVIFQHQVRVDDWKGGVMRTPPKSWTTYTDRNEVGSFKRNFEVPSNWDGREVFLNFDGVDNFFYLWINGRYVGFSKNSRNLASFNVTSYLQKGNNTVAIEVYRSSDASFLEAQDMFRLPGIFRSVYLTSTPKVSIRDLMAVPDLDANYDNGTLRITSDVRNLSKAMAINYKIVYSLYANKLYSDDNVLVANTNSAELLSNIEANKSETTTSVLKVPHPKKWSAESPYRYTLVAELKNNKNKTVETISTTVGFRKVEIKQTNASDDEFGLAGRYYFINGKTVKLKGVNRHETNPEKGKVVTRKQMEEEIGLMKRANINHVRTSHYPNDPYWYYLCDKYGIYLESEANLESHEYYYGEASLSHPKEWKSAHIARNIEMVHALINCPSIVIWSLGNEAGPGDNFIASYKAIKNVDTTRPIQYERNNNIVDMGSNQYPSIDWVRGAVKGKYELKYPFHISEYAHSMGNATGNLIDYWDAMESTNYFMGGAIWDWVDQAMWYYDKKTGQKFLAYGGDFGDKPNDGTFVNNGLIFADRIPKPAYYEVKKVYQNMAVKAIDITKGEVSIFNKQYFDSFKDYMVEWSLYKDGIEIKRDAIPSEFVESIGPRQNKIYKIPFQYETLDPIGEYFVKIQFLLKEDHLWAKKGFAQMEEQILVKNSSERPSVLTVQNNIAQPEMQNEPSLKVVKGSNFIAKFDLNTGSIYSLKYGNTTVIEDGDGPKLDAFRAPVDNDNWAYKQWFEIGLHNLKHKALNNTVYQRKDGAWVLSFLVESQAPNGATINGGTSGTYTLTEHLDKPFDSNDFKFTTNQIWTVYADGSIELSSSISSNNDAQVLPRLGYSFKMPKSYEHYTYYGRGPFNNYADRKTGQFIELHKSSVLGQYVPWPNPQSMSNNEEVRWSALTDSTGQGAVFIGKDPMSSSVLPWSELDLTLASHPYKLPNSTGTFVHLDAAVTGLGGNSCGQGPPLEKDRVKSDARRFGFIIRPVSKNNFNTISNVSGAGQSPIAVVRDRKGQVAITGVDSLQYVYVLGNGKEKNYSSSFDLRDGGIVTAWEKSNPLLKVSYTFPKMETVQLTVVSASSVENGEGDAEHLVDGDPGTIWHTMYSVTVAQYPHWVDFDAGEVKSIKGFTYLPRQDGANGNIKAYKLQVSEDGKTWGDPIANGQFERNSKLQTIRLNKPVKGRFVRFTALSSQNGQDFASGAEFGLLAN
ncbi:MAG: beta-galactosidase [Pseudopedobacter saltans]|uniref:beta-galactosidase n=1 Tax=Pseudopedobacter saltans TaxID=151895 RepID=A0A2W5F0C4_9SPHI|nr:MAG: beta-galactosidase [Pseudopedobacter saltans]